ncbi:MAG: putative cellulase [Capsulimonas sp.]|nr:putative cellulase [Capsulimonas sp.]
MFRKVCGWAAMLSLSLIPYSASAQTDAGKRVSALYTSWDDYYFYAAFQVNDRNVVGVNNTPISQPQQDDDIEIFFETDRARAKVRTPHTFQMAVSAAGGSYFSIGDNGKIPKAKVVYTYKYAAKVDGTLNDPSDGDTGYTVEIAIPWAELGVTKPPKDGTAWGFNVISRDRSSTAVAGDRFYSLSAGVQSAEDVQDPSKWASIVFTSGGTAPEASDKTVVSPRVVTRFPLINGSVVSGEWPSISRASFGAKAITGNAPTAAEEPNTADSPFAAPPPEAVKPPKPDPGPIVPETPTTPVVKNPTTGPPTSIELPGGGSIKIVPGGIHTVPGEQTASNSGVDTRPRRNPLTPKFPAGYTPQAPSVSLTGSLQLTPAKAPALVMAIYRVDYNADGRKAPSQNVWNAQGRTQLMDQPMDGAGPWFSGLRASWHRQQLSELRRAGINIALIRARKDDPLLTKELSALVQALKQMAADGEDYPLIGVCRSGADGADYNDIYSRIPVQFRCTLELPTTEGNPMPPAYLVYDADGQSDTNGKALTDGGQVIILSSVDNIATVTPGGAHGAAITSRAGGDAYAASWASAIESHPAMIVIDSWNDFTHGTELAPSRQYAQQYVDQTRLKTIEFNGAHQWHAKYLSEAAPRTIQQKRLYQIPIRIENAGSLPWRAGEDYALCPRWYKDGRLYDDSAPRVPLGRNVAPGDSITLSVGVVAINGYGDSLETGDYTLVFDMVQGPDRWFSYASDTPLQIPVTVVKAGDDAATTRQDVTFLSATTPTVLGAGASYDTKVTLRNDGSAPWPAGQTTLVYKIQRMNGDTLEAVSISDGVPVSAAAVLPGQVVTVPVTLAASAADKPLTPGEYRIHWYLKPASADIVTAGTHDEWVQVTDSDSAASFVLSNVPRTVSAGKDTEAHLAVQNLGATAWTKTDRKIGYHWYYLDGTEVSSTGGALAPLTKNVLPGRADGDIVAKFRAPDQPGRYILAWDVQLPDGSWQSASPISRGTDLYPMVITVTGKGGPTVPVDLTSAANAAGVYGDGATDGVDFDGKGAALPAEMLPPDGSGEIDLIALLAPKPSPPLYPAGYYSGQSGEGSKSNHAHSFLFPTGKNNVVVCKGQQITLPGGNYKAIHILAAATGGAPVTATFSPGPSAKSASLTIEDWLTPPTDGQTGWWSPYHIVQGVPTPTPCYLGDYAIAVDPSVKISSLILPNDPSIKIVAISLEK